MLQVFYLLIFVYSETDFVHFGKVIVVALGAREHRASLRSQLELLNILIQRINSGLQEVILLLQLLLIELSLFFLVDGLLKLELFQV